LSEAGAIPSIVADIMSSPVVTVDIQTTAKDAANIMVENRIGSIIVTEKGGAIGIVTERDMLERVLALGKDPLSVSVNEIMSRPLVSINKQAPILEAIRMMRRHNVRCLPVMENHKLAGLVTERDIIKAVALASLTSFHSLLTIK
jgi:CBS domain-containing protein